MLRSTPAFRCWLAARGIDSILFGVSALYPGIIGSASITVIATGLLAAAVPLWRATRVDPLRNLRDA